jgi:dihydroorotate dehydrogenase electron transfer subunit
VRLAEAQVVERRAVADRLTLLWLSAPEVSGRARPGQFTMLRLGDGFDPFLARPFWIHRVRDGADGEELALLIEAVGRVTALLCRAEPGWPLRLLGPLGRAVPLRPGVRNLLLVADGAGIAPLVWLADEETVRGRSVTLLLGGRSGEQLYPLELLQPEVEVAVATDDGSRGRRGSVAELVGDYATWADEIVACGPVELYRALAGVLRRLLWRRPCQVLLQVPIACGTGLCGDCAVPTRRRGTALACRVGPAFDLHDLV